MRRKIRRRFISASIVAALLGIAIVGAAIPSGSLRAQPRITVIRHLVGVGSVGTLALVNSAPMPVSVGSITYSCDTAMQLQNGSGGTPFMIGPGSAAMIAIECPSTLPVGMQRCTFTVNDTDDLPALNFLGVCETAAPAAGSGLVAAPNPLNFPGSVPIGTDSTPQSVMINNLSGMPINTLQLQTDNDSFLIGNPCTQNLISCDVGGIPAGTGVSIDVICHPRASGNLTGRLFAIGDNGIVMATPVQLQCNGDVMMGSGIAILDPGSINAGSVEVLDPAFAPAMVEIRNAGSDSIAVTAVSIADDGVPNASLDWSITGFTGQCSTLVPPCQLASGEAVNVQLGFDPEALGARPARLNVTYTNPGTQQVSASLNGSGVGATVELASNETTLDFGVVPLGVSSAKTFALKNLGNRAADATLAMNPPNAPFSFPPTVTVTPGINSNVTVTCQSATPTNATATLTIAAPNTLSGDVVLTLVCDVRDTIIAAMPSSFNFMERRASSGSVQQQFTITRVGAGSAVGLLERMFETRSPDVTVSALSQLATPATLTVTVNPQNDGPLTTTITVTPTGGLMPITIPISGSVVTPSFTVDDVVPLGTFCVGQETTGAQITLMSNGSGRFLLEEPAMLGEPSDFLIAPQSPSSFPAQLDPLGTASVLVTPKRSTAASEVEDFVVWTADFGAPVQTRVTAEFVSDGGAIAPELLEFGDFQIHVATSPPQTVTLQNCSTGDLVLMEPVVPLPFVLVNQFPTTLAPAQKATFEVAFRPTEPGPVERTLTITSASNETFSVVLRGNGTTDGTGPDDDDGQPVETSFYACGCRTNDPSGVLAIAVAFGLAFLPRRRARRGG